MLKSFSEEVFEFDVVEFSCSRFKFWKYEGNEFVF